jgi:hypothetical protein
MRLISSFTEIITKEIHKVVYEEKEYTLIWFLNPNSNKIIDTVLRDKQGNSVDDAKILEEIEKFVLEQTDSLSVKVLTFHTQGLTMNKSTKRFLS